MNNTEIYIGKNTPVNKEQLWLRPLNPGVSLYGNVNGKWEPLKLIDGKGTRTVEDDEVINVIGDVYSKEEIDERFADILGLDAEGIAELKALIEDEDSLTGLLSEINNKADKSDLENVAYTDAANRFTNANYFRHGESNTAVIINNGGVSVFLASNQNQQWCDVEKDCIAFCDTAIGQIAFKPILNSGVVRLAGGVNHTNYKPLAYLEDLDGKQDTLVSGTNIRTINGNSILNAGNLKLERPFSHEQVRDSSAFNSAAGAYYTCPNVVDYGCMIRLPLNPTANDIIGFYLTTGEHLSGISWSGGSKPRLFEKGYAIEPNKTYEIIAFYNGSAWLISAIEFE